MSERGQPGEPGAPGREGGGTGGVGGTGGTGEVTGGAGGPGGVGGSASRHSAARSIRTIAATALILAALAVLVDVALFKRTLDQGENLCTNQHSMIELQRLFLKEHEALRVDMAKVGVSKEHDQHLLDRIAVLIERADCHPNE